MSASTPFTQTQMRKTTKGTFGTESPTQIFQLDATLQRNGPFHCVPLRSYDISPRRTQLNDHGEDQNQGKNRLKPLHCNPGHIKNFVVTLFQLPPRQEWLAAMSAWFFVLRATGIGFHNNVGAPSCLTIQKKSPVVNFQMLVLERSARMSTRKHACLLLLLMKTTTSCLLAIDSEWRIGSL